MVPSLTEYYEGDCKLAGGRPPIFSLAEWKCLVFNHNKVLKNLISPCNHLIISEYLLKKILLL